MKKLLFTALLTILLAGLFLFPVHAQQLDFGDAPEGALAYPTLGVIGAFPTCMTVGPASWIQHTNFGAYFGPGVDFEPDGNGGLCPMFSPYDADECFLDGDAGLLIPQSYTIVGGVVVPCPILGGPPALGLTCQTATWGLNIDIDVSNFMPSQATGYANVLIDWDQNGVWGGSSSCPPAGTPAPEHVLVDFPVPNGFTGPLSALVPPSFLIGPNPGYVWARFTISELPVGSVWDGSGQFEDGESEDYLLEVDSDQPTIFPEIQTECPVVDTQCPIIDTQCPQDPVLTVCPVSQTNCPVNTTACPVVLTQCPPDPTVCSVVVTECPDPTNCPLDDTHCPVQQTFCPIIDTQCPVDPVQTICPENTTECPVVETECPATVTDCPAVPTNCPIDPTLCPKDPPFCPPEEFTIWPELPTMCPVVFTSCPQGPTLCPDLPTSCPGTTTWCPEVPTQCPLDPFFTICPENATFCPDMATECPLDWTFCPDVPTICPDLATACPEVPTQCPEVPTECPDTFTQCPVDPTFCPSLQTECPVSPTQCPVDETNCPTGATWCPTDPTNCPQVTTECPVSTTQCPVDETNCPTGATWCPTSPTLCPVLDSDGDGVIDCYDNCPATPNGPLLGSCVETASGVVLRAGTPVTTCNSDTDCGAGQVCDTVQGDFNSNGCGDACECYADFSGDGKVDLTDLVIMKTEFLKPCPPSPCSADANGDGKVDLQDLVILKKEFLRNDCPSCP